MPRHRSSAVPLALAYAALIGYASLYPFDGWQWPTRGGWSWLALPWLHIWTRFDALANLLGYLPLGGLIFLAGVRRGRGAVWAAALATLGGAALSGAMEELQNFLPTRVPSMLDWVLNTAGALIGAMLVWAVHRTGGVDRWQVIRERWFLPGSAGGLALLLLWPVGLLFPPPLPLGLGQGIARIPEWLRQAAEGTALAEAVDWPEAATALAASPSSFLIAVATAFGLLAPCLLAFSVSRPGARRVAIALALAATGFGVTTLSTALNFGPDHALAWQTRTAGPGFLLGALLALLSWRMPPRLAAGFALAVLGVLATLVAQSATDPYYAQSLQGWEQGRFIRFHGIAQWVGWWWPYAAMLHLLTRVAARDAAVPTILQ